MASNLNLHSAQSLQADEYELIKAGGRPKLTSSSSKQRIGRLIGSQAQSKQSQSKLLATSTVGSNQQVIETATHPKKLERDAKMLFSPVQGTMRKS